MKAFTLCALLLTQSAYAQDAIDLRQVAVHGSPGDVSSYAQTVTITGLTMKATGQANPDGLSFQANVPESWDYHIPGWGSGVGCPNDGCILYTVWAIVRVNGQWHMAGFIQMYRGKPATGAPILTDFHRNWAYDRARWGELYDYQPQPGDQMGFFLTAGNARFGSEWSPRHERSNVVMVPLPVGDSGSWTFNEPPPWQPPPPPPNPPIVSTDLSPLLNNLQAMQGYLTQVIEQEGEKTRAEVRDLKLHADNFFKQIMPYVAAVLAALGVAMK